MTDVFTQKERSRVMSKIRDRNTKPELKVRSIIHRLGFRFSLHRRDLAGKPDIVLSKYKKAIFVHGCFWHLHSKCRDGRMPKSRAEYWQPKLEGNKERDSANIRALKKRGWKILKLWECEIERKAQKSVKKITHFLGKK